MQVLVALSGGVDSAVAAALLTAAGHSIVGVHLQFWSDTSCRTSGKTLPENKCCSTAALEAARGVAAQLDFPFYVLNFRNAFKTKVVDEFLAVSEAGGTPNPCITCNREIKFGLLLQKMHELGCEALATGHFVRIHTEPDSTRLLRASTDDTKDQTYFLHQLTQDRLQHLIFPVGELTKREVFAKSRELGLVTTSDTAESQGACFFPEREPADFLRRHLPERSFTPGPICTLDGERLGTHSGLTLYTIGQRRGIDLGGLAEPHYVVRRDYTTNTLYIAPDSATYAQSCRVTPLTWAGTPPSPGDTLETGVRTRYRGPITPASVTLDPSGSSATITFAQPVRALTPGQAAVFYRNDGCVLGGGTITTP